MKKYIFCIFIFLCVTICYGQERVADYITYLERPVPEGFQRMNRTTYLDNTGNIVLSTENNLVKVCAVGASFKYTNEALEWLAYFYNYFEDTRWEFFEEEGLEIYKKYNVYAIISGAEKREDGQIVSMVILTRDLEWLLGNM